MALTKEQQARAERLRAAIDAGITAANESPTVINEMMDVIYEWSPGVYKMGDVRMYNNIPYRCKQAHDSTANPTWNPAETPALWGHYHGTTPDTARPFEADSANVYKVGEYCTENDKIYLNNYENNVYAPSVLPDRWTEVTI